MLKLELGVGYNSRIDLGRNQGGTPHITSHATQNQGGTLHKKMCSDIHTGVGTPHITSHTTWNQGGRIQDGAECGNNQIFKQRTF